MLKHEATPRRLWRNARLATLREGAAGTRPRGRTARFSSKTAASCSPDVKATFRRRQTLDAEPIDCDGRLVTPALIDCHTHLVFGGNRAQEFERRLGRARPTNKSRGRGAAFSRTVRATNARTEDQLVAESLPRLDALLAEGVGTVEIKSGYGLSIRGRVENAPRAARRLETLRPVRVRTTYLAAHATPPEYAGRNRRIPVAEVVLPGMEQAHADGLIDAVDGFCEGIAFSPAEMRSGVREGGARSACRSNCTRSSARTSAGRSWPRPTVRCPPIIWNIWMRKACPHLARAGTVAVLLPGAFYIAA